MSKSVFEKKYTNRLLNKLNKERRDSLQVKKGQVIILADTKELKLAINQVYPGLKIKNPPLVRALKAGRKRAAGLQRNVKKAKRLAIERKLPSVLPESKFRLGVNIFIINNFSTASLVKDAMLDKLVEDKVLSQEQADNVAPKLHKGHGVQGNAVSQVEIASTGAGMTKQEISILQAGINKFAQLGEISYVQAMEINKLITQHDMIVTKRGSLKAHYFSILNFQHESGNLNDGTDEKALKAAYRKFLEEVNPELLNLEGSSSMKQKVISILGDAIKSSTKGSAKIKVNYDKVELKTGSTTQAKGKPHKSSIKKSTRGNTKVRIRNKGVASNPLQLFLAMNSKLPDVVAKNMQSPRLNYRTGRFANSVKIVDVVTTPQGFSSVGYTYQKSPYQTFEPGFAQGDPNRDPRKLIDTSIRELAAQFAIGRFYTRRL